MSPKFKYTLALVVVAILVFPIASSSVKKVSASFFDNFLKRAGIVRDNKHEAVSKKEIHIPYSSSVDYEQAVINAVDEGLKSVVSIAISKDVPVLEQCAYDPFSNLPPEFRQFFGGSQFTEPCDNGKKARREVGGGSGFIVSEDGLILTNKHVVVDEKADYTVITSNGNKYDAKVLARDPVQDIAIIKIDKTGLTPAKLGDSNSLKLGQTAIAIGNALAEFKNTVSVGVISGLSRKIVATGYQTSESIENLIQTDAAINPGNSGGPLLNLKGEVIGINVAVAQGAQNIGFTIPINQAKKDILSVQKTGAIKAAFIGVRYLMITEEIAKKQNLSSTYGALLRGGDDGPAILAKSPADKAGLIVEDIVLEVNGERLEGGKTLASVVQKYSVGESLALKIKRGSDTLTVTVILEERPSS